MVVNVNALTFINSLLGGQADANKGHAFGIFMALVDSLHSLPFFRCPLI